MNEFNRSDLEILKWKWTPIAQIKIGDVVAHWGCEDVVLQITKEKDHWCVKVFDSLLQKEQTHLFKLTDELLVKQFNQQ